VAGNSDSVKRGNTTRAEQAKRRDQDSGTPEPIAGTGAWARARGICKDGDTEGPGPGKTSPKS